MKNTCRFLGLLLIPFLLGGLALFSETNPPLLHFGVGLNYGGIQGDWRPSPRWMFELRAQKGSDTSPNEARATTQGLRIYRFHESGKTLVSYLGMEGAYLKAEQLNSAYRASGYSLGAFGGLGFKLTRRFFLDFDIGPYAIHLKEKRTGTDKMEVNIVGDTSLILFF